MNVNLLVFAKSEAARRRMPSLAEQARGFLFRIFGHDDPDIVLDEDSIIYNSNSMERTWQVPAMLTGPWGCLSFSMPPVPLTTEVATESWADAVKRLTVTEFHPEQLSPNYFGILKSNGKFQVWPDHVGVGRCYVIDNDDFIAISNHIGVLTLFSAEPIRVDEDAVAKFIHFGWFTGDTTPLTGIRRVPPATQIQIDEGGVRWSRYMDLSEIYAENDEKPNFDAAVEQMMLVDRNLDSIVNATPTVFLSGGQDSRMTAATWLAGGASARVLSYGDLAREAEIASELIRLYSEDHDLNEQGVTHEVKLQSQTTVTMPVQERLTNAFDMWDGDAPPVKIRNAVRPLNPKSFSVSGLGGEIIHGHYYSNDRRRKQVESGGAPLSVLERVFCNSKVATTEAAKSVEGFMDRKAEEYSALNLDRYGSLDYFFLEERMRRGAPQSLHTVSPVPLCVPNFQRMAFRLTPDERVSRRGVKELVSRAIPKWSNVPTYKPTKEETSKDMKKGNRIWMTDPDYFYHRLSSPDQWDRYLDASVISDNLKLIGTAEMTQMYESRFTFALWIDYLYEHAKGLERNRIRSST